MTDTSIPVAAVSLPLMNRLPHLKTVTKRDDSVAKFEELLRSEFSARWEELRKQRAASQGFLFGGSADDRLV